MLDQLAVFAFRHCWVALSLSQAMIAAAADRVIESVVPGLVYNRVCASTVALQNLADRPVAVDIEAHQGSGALAPLAGLTGMQVRLAPGQQSSYRLQIDDDTNTGWVKIREKISPPQISAAVAIKGSMECQARDELRVVPRIPAFASRDPWFSGDVSEMPGEVILMVNASDRPAQAHACYSAGNLFSVPNLNPPGELRRICSNTVDVQIPPFGSREFPVEREGNRHFSLRTEGESVVLQGLRALDAAVKIYSVDSTITFGEEVSSRH